jgi:hypothetical protein
LVQPDLCHTRPEGARLADTAEQAKTIVSLLSRARASNGCNGQEPEPKSINWMHLPKTGVWRVTRET